MKKIFAALVAVPVLLGISYGGEDPFLAMKSSIKEKTLNNGMKFIVLENHTSPVISFHLYADVGSAQEKDGTSGIAHLLEHLAFKGTTTVGTKDYASEKPILDEEDSVYEELMNEKFSSSPDKIKLAGLSARFAELEKKAKQYVVNNEYFDMLLGAGDAKVNAYTSTDATQYVNSLPSNKLEFWMSISSDRFLHPVFREFYKEKNVVMEERRLSLENNPQRRLLEDFFASAFKAHPYRRSVVGHMSDLERMTRKDVVNFYNEYYTPDNLCAVVVGDVDSKKVFSMAETYFGRLKKGHAEKSLRTVEPEQWGERKVTVSAAAEPIVMIGYKRPSASDASDNAIQALVHILGEGRSSRLNERLVKKDRIAAEVGVDSSSPGDKYPSMIMFYVVPIKGVSTDKIISAIDDEIKQISEKGVTETEIIKYKSVQKKMLIGMMKNNASMAKVLAYYQEIKGNWNKLFQDIDDMELLKPSDIKDAAAKYLIKKNRTIGEIVPERVEAKK
jgi:predicted Zn-dependent peptidase